MPEREKRAIPNWAERERTEDLAWLGENLPQFWTVARRRFEAAGRGALVIDLVALATGTGHQFGYVAQEQIRQMGGQEEIRMLAAYNPAWEMIIIFLKPKERMNSYRVGVPGQHFNVKTP